MPQRALRAGAAAATGIWLLCVSACASQPAASSSAPEHRPVNVSVPAAATTPDPPDPTHVGRPRQEPPDQIECSQEPCVALTFDDGPGTSTDLLLTELDRENVKATFFLIGRNVLNFPAQVHREEALGMEIGDHTQNHADLSKLGPGAAWSEIETCARNINGVLGKRPQLLRPPYGSFTAGVTPADGMAVILWSDDTLDWQTRDTQITVRKAVEDIRPGGIILMHDIHPSTVAAVPAIIARLREAGYKLVTVSKLLDGPKPGFSYRSR